MNYAAGVYAIVNTIDAKRYIGSSVHVSARLRRHVMLLRRGRHHNVHLQRAWNKHGAGVFEFRKIITCAPELVRDYERRCIRGLRPEYNISQDTVAPMCGRKHTPEAKARMSAAQRGKRKPDGFAETISRIKRGNTNTRGMRHTPESIEKMRVAALGKRHSEATKEKLRRINSGKRYLPRSVESRQCSVVAITKWHANRKAACDV